jgi:2-keto-4-pentenoate hydratase/2-oxohepta-3-ene-1,7-dioic acid hydratase in catechol pathway
MKLASLKSGHRDGALAIVDRTLTRAVAIRDIPTLQAALDDWAQAEPVLADLSAKLDAGRLDGMPFDPGACLSPLPRAFQWADGSAYVNHVALVRKARGAELPASFWTDPLMYQGGSDAFLAPNDPIPLSDPKWGCDFEAEIAIITDDVAPGTDAVAAASRIRLVMLVNDVSLRGLIPEELAKGFGFFQSKPASSFSPVAVTPAVRLPGCGDRHDLRLPDPHRPCRQDAGPLSRHDHRLGHGFQSGAGWRTRHMGHRGRARLFLHRRAAHGGTDRQRPGSDALPQTRRPCAHRHAGWGGEVDLRRN